MKEKKFGMMYGWKMGRKQGITAALAVALIFILVPLVRPMGRTVASDGRIAAAESPSVEVGAERSLLLAQLEEAAQNRTGQIVNFVTGDRVEFSTDILSRLAGSDVTLAMQVGKGMAFSIGGQDVRRIDRPVRLTVSYTPAIPAQAKGLVPDKDVLLRFGTEEKGAYPCRVNAHLALGASNAGSYAVLYSYDETAGAMRQEESFQIDGAGQAVFGLTRGDEYLVAIYYGYLVEHGDSLARIAARKGISLRNLKAANPQIKDFNLIRPGQMIYLPTL